MSPRRLLIVTVLLAPLCNCKTETKIDKSEPAAAEEEKPIITEETRSRDADMKTEMESICQALKKCRTDQCDSKEVLKALALKSPYATGLRDRLISTDLAEKTIYEFTQNARGLGARCDLEAKAPGR